MGLEGLLQLNLNSSLWGWYVRIKPESAGRTPDNPAPVVNLTGAGYIRFVSIVLAVGAAFLAFDVFLQVRKVAVTGNLNPHPFSRSLLYGLSLAFIAFLLWSYSGAILDFPETKATGA